VLFRTEDEMYKVDYELGNYYKTMKVLEEEKLKLDNMTMQEKENYKLPDKFNLLRLKWIE
jgi:histone deacetylase complex regulatory component SIN3